MPLSTGKSKSAFRQNIETEVKAGKPVKQAVAVAYAQRKKMAKGGTATPSDVETPEMRHASELATGRKEGEDFGEDVGHGFPGGGAQSSAVQPAELAIEAAPLAAGAASRAGKFVADLPLKAHEAVAAYRTASKFGGKPVVSAVREFMHARTVPKDAISGLMDDATAAFQAKYDTPEKLAQFHKDASDYQAFLQKWREMHDPGATAATTGVGSAGVKLEQIAPEAVGEALKKNQVGRVPLPAPRTSALPAAEQFAGKAPAPTRPLFSSGQPAHVQGVIPNEAVSKQKNLVDTYLQTKGKPKKFNAGGTAHVWDGVAKKAGENQDGVLIRDAFTDQVGKRMKPASKEGEKIMRTEHIDPSETFPAAPEDVGKHNLPTLTEEKALVAHHDADIKPEQLYASIADTLHKQYFAVGGTVQPDEEVQPRADVPPLDSPLAARAAYTPHIVGVDTHPVTIDSQSPDPALEAPPVQHAATAGVAPQEALNQTADLAAAKNDGPGALDQIEQQRRQDLEATKPGIGAKIGRVVSSALLGFAGKPVIDFAAGDKASRDEINAEADRRRGAYIGQPAEEASRQAALSDSPVSRSVRALVGQVTGKPQIASGMSALEVKGIQPLVSDYLQAKAAGNALRMQELKAEMEASFRGAQLGQGQQRLGIEQQNADTAVLRASKADKQHQNEAAQKVNQMLAGARGLPDYRNAREAIRNIDSALLLAKKPELSQQEVELLAGELGKIATGGAAPESLVKLLSAPTVQGKIEQAKRYLTGKPGDAGYKLIIHNYTKYLNALRQNNLRTIVGTQREIVEPVKDQVPEIYNNLKTDPLYYEKVRDAAGEAVPAQGAPDQGADQDAFKALGGFAE